MNFTSEDEDVTPDYSYARVHSATGYHDSSSRLNSMPGTSHRQRHHSAMRGSPTERYGTESTAAKSKKSRNQSKSMWNQSLMTDIPSSSTLMHSSFYFSFGKDGRFEKKRPASDRLNAILSIPSSLGTKTCTQGFGKRRSIRSQFGRDAPSPNKYEINRSLVNPDKKFHFGVPYSCYRNVIIASFKKGAATEKVNEAPGPGAYDVGSAIGKFSRKFSMYPKVETVDPATKKLPPNQYLINDELLKNQRYWGITFGIGGRTKYRINATPGPGAYEIKSKFDRRSQSVSERHAKKRALV